MKLNHWEYKSFESIYKIPSRNGLTVKTSERGSGYPMVNMSELFSMGRISVTPEMELAPLTEKQTEGYLLNSRDLLFGRQSLTLEGAGKCSIVMESEKPLTFESHLIRVRLDEKKADSRFYYYLFKSKYGKALMGQIVEQVAVAGIRSSDLATLEVPVPPTKYQSEIADALESIDAYVEKLDFFSESVRKLSQAQFDKMAAETNGMTVLDEYAVINPDRAKKATNELVTFIEIGDVGNGYVAWPEKIIWSEAPVAARNLVVNGDVIWSRVRPNRRSHAYLISKVENVVVTTGMVVIRSKDEIPSSFINAITDSEHFARQLATLSDGTAYPTVDEGIVRNTSVPKMSKNQISSFDAEMKPLWDYVSKIENIKKQLIADTDELLMPLFKDAINVGSK